MVIKIAHPLALTVWLSLLLLSFHGWFATSSTFKHGNSADSLTSLSPHSLTTRKALATKFDFTPFTRRHHQKHAAERSEPPPGNEIDPRYGVEKRLVPTGPNPLHH